MFAEWKTLLSGWKYKTQAWRKNLQNTYLIKDLYPKCAKNTHNLTVRKETTQEENGQNSEQISHQRRYIDGKKIYEKIVNYMSLGNCKWKKQWNNIICLLE